MRVLCDRSARSICSTPPSTPTTTLNLYLSTDGVGRGSGAGGEEKKNVEDQVFLDMSSSFVDEDEHETTRLQLEARIQFELAARLERTTPTNLWSAVVQYIALAMKTSQSGMSMSNNIISNLILAASGNNHTSQNQLESTLAAATTATNGTAVELGCTETTTLGSCKGHLSNHKNGVVTHNSSSRRGWRELAKSTFARNRPSKQNNGQNFQRQTNKSNIADIVKALDPKDLNILQLLALNSLDLAAPASDIILKSSRSPDITRSTSPVNNGQSTKCSSLSVSSNLQQQLQHANNSNKKWVQCSGHEGAFAPAAPGTIWKKVSGCAEVDFEVRAYSQLMRDVMRDSVPAYYGDLKYKDEVFVEMEDLLSGFGPNPCIMDIKMGTRTFLESEASNSKPRADLYDKMVKIDTTAPTEAEHEAKAVTKLRYMAFRESLSSSGTLGFRIEGISSSNEEAKDLDFTRIKERAETEVAFRSFVGSQNTQLRDQLIRKLKSLRSKFQASDFFSRHEVIGSSILIVHDGQRVGVWMIDFAKTVPLPDSVTIDHMSPWTLGNHEDGYLFGLGNLIDVLESLAM